MPASGLALPPLVALPLLLRHLPWVVGLALLLTACGLGWRGWAGRRDVPLWRCLLTRRGLILGGGALVLAGLALSVAGMAWRVVFGVLLGAYLGGCALTHFGRDVWPATVAADCSGSTDQPREPGPIPGWLYPTLWAAVAIPLWFPDSRLQATILALALVGTSLLVVAVLGVRPGVSVAHAPALVVLITAALVSAWLGGVEDLTVPKLTGLLLGLYGFWALRRWHGAGASLVTLALWCGALTLGFALVGLVGGLRPTKVGPLGDLLAQMPKLVQSLPGTQHGRVSMNQLGGAIVHVAPVLIALVTCLPRSGARQHDYTWLGWVLSLFGSVALLAALVLAQSRSAWAGMVTALLVLLLGRARWGPWALLVLLLGGLGAWIAWGQSAIAPRLVQALLGPLPTPWGTVTLRGRLSIWEDAASYILRNPWRGQGLGVFRLEGIQDLAGRSPIDVGMPHAHNVWLGVAYDLGLPGLAAYLSLLLTAAIDGVRALGRLEGPPRQVVLGALAGLAGAHVYGLMDAVALGAKPGVLFWMLLGLLSVVHQCAASRPSEAPGRFAHAPGQV